MNLILFWAQNLLVWDRGGGITCLLCRAAGLQVVNRVKDPKPNPKQISCIPLAFAYGKREKIIGPWSYSQ